LITTLPGLRSSIGSAKKASVRHAEALGDRSGQQATLVVPAFLSVGSTGGNPGDQVDWLNHFSR
jgi:hypothetical protein